MVTPHSSPNSVRVSSSVYTRAVFGLVVMLVLFAVFGQQVFTTNPKTTLLPWGRIFAVMNSCYDLKRYFRISLLVFMASVIFSARLQNAPCYKLLGLIGDLASHRLIVF